MLDVSETYIWPEPSELEMYGSANDIIASCFVVVPIRFLRQDAHTLVDATPLCVRSRTALLCRSAKLLDCVLLVLRIGYWDAESSFQSRGLRFVIQASYLRTAPS